MWPLRIAASVVLLIAVYFSITPLLEKENQQLAQQKPEVEKKSKGEENTISDTIKNHSDQLAVVTEPKPKADKKKI